MSTNAEASDIVSRAIVAFTGWGVAKTPQADAKAVESVAQSAGVDAAALFESVHSAIAASDEIDPPGDDLQDPTAGQAYKTSLRRARPDLSDAAIDALASRWFFRRMWLGVEDPPAGAGQTTRYFSLFAPRGTERVPRALFRRRLVDGEAVDEVLRDVDVWSPDEAGRVHHAIDRYLDSDLEEISAAQAREFERMVANRSYHPFTTP